MVGRYHGARLWRRGLAAVVGLLSAGGDSLGARFPRRGLAAVVGLLSAGGSSLGARLPRQGLAAVAIQVLVASGAWGQVTTGNIRGTVKTTGGEALPGVSVTATLATQGRTWRALTGETGVYVLRNLTVGNYTVLFDFIGRQSVKRPVTVEIGETSICDVVMLPEAVEETLVVSASRPLVVLDPSAGVTISEEDLQSLPTLSRDFLDLTRVHPIVSAGTDQGEISIAGSSGSESLFIVDGRILADPFAGSGGEGIIGGALLEIQTLVGGISAEFGGFTGGAVNVLTKSGANRFAFTLRAAASSPGWRQETPLEERLGIELDDRRGEDLQLTFGGPILRDRFWFFLAGQQAEDLSQEVFEATATPFLRSGESRRFEVKLEGALTDSHHLRLGYRDGRTDLESPSFDLSVDPGTVDPRREGGDALLLRYDGVQTARLFVEARASRGTSSSRDAGGAETDLRSSPFLSFRQGFQHYNAPYLDASDPRRTRDDQVSASLSAFLPSGSWGSHDLKIGGAYRDETRTGGFSPSATGFVFEAEVLRDAKGAAVLDGDGRLMPLWRPGGTFLQSWRSEPGAEVGTETTSAYVNDEWRLGLRWMLNLGLRYDAVEGTARGGRPPVETAALVPRLAASFDPGGDGEHLLGLTYAEYAGPFADSLLGGTSGGGLPDLVRLVYQGPEGSGLAFAPAFDLGSYAPVSVSLSPGNLEAAPDLDAPRVQEVTLSAATRFRRRGELRLTYLDRRARDLIDDFVDRPGDPVPVEGVEGLSLADRRTFRNAPGARRRYQGLQLEAKARFMDAWKVQGHWTLQLTNEGNLEPDEARFPERTSPFGDYPEILDGGRSAPSGRLSTFQRHRGRLWTTYDWDLDWPADGGRLTFGLLAKYDSARTFSFRRLGFPLSEIQLRKAEEAGYVTPPRTQSLYFGERGAGSFEDSFSVDLAVTYDFPLWKNLRGWVKADVFNLLGSEALLSFDTTVEPDLEGPLDENGLPTTFAEGPRFGQGTVNDDFLAPREFRLSVGLRF